MDYGKVFYEHLRSGIVLKERFTEELKNRRNAHFLQFALQASANPEQADAHWEAYKATLDRYEREVELLVKMRAAELRMRSKMVDKG